MISFFNYLEKRAEILNQLQPHQQRVIDKMKTQRGLVVAHSMGKGKTFTSLASQDALKMPSTVITPASLKDNFKKEYTKHISNGASISQDSIENVARKQEFKPNPLVIVDEAHRLRNPGSKITQALKKADPEKLMLLTGSSMVNHPVDIAPLVNLASGESLLPENKDEFEKKYLYEKTVKPSFMNKLRGIKPGTESVLNRNEKENLSQILNKWVDYEPPSQEGFPEVERQNIEVPMSTRQLATYNSILGKAPSWVSAKIRSNMPTNKQESRDLNAYLQGARQVANTTAPYTTNEDHIESPKIDRAFQELKRVLGNHGKGVVYSNYIGAGIDPYKKLLEQDKTIPFGEYSGRVDQSTRNQMIQDYNSGKIRALLLGPSGGEGLDLKKTKLMQILDPSWNESKGNQAEARAIRYKSHEGLEKEKQRVLVQRFLSTHPQGLMERAGLSKTPTSVDQYLTNLSHRKAMLSKQFEDLMLQNS